MQSDEPQIHTLRRAIMAFIWSLMVEFVKPSAFSGCALEKVPYKVRHQQKKDAARLIDFYRLIEYVV
jgi:hypothetical protein